ncbi:MAG: hypothetical protein RR555_09960 [Bacteroidales bacterium]
MSKSKSAYWTHALVLLLAGLFITSFLVPMRDKTDEWIPLLSGFVDIDVLYGNRLLLILGGILGIVGLAVSVYFIVAKMVSESFSIYYTQLFLLLIILTNPMSIYFSAIYPAAILVVWVIYCFMQNQRFTALFLLSCASLFYAPIIWMVPVVLVILLAGVPDFWRVFIKAAGGMFIPYLYILAFRFVCFNDMDVFIHQYFQEVIRLDFPIYSLSFITLFMTLCFAILLGHALLYILKRLNRQNILSGVVLRMTILASLLGVLIFFLFWGGKSTPLCVLIAGPFSLLLSNYALENKATYSFHAELILFMSAVAVARATHFI